MLIGVAADIPRVIFKTSPIVAGVRNEDLGLLGLLVIRLLKALAVPLIAIPDAFLQVEISVRRGGWLILICLVNVSVAFAIGLTLLNTLRPGNKWRGRLNEIAGMVGHDGGSLSTTNPEAPKTTLDPLKNIAGYVPEMTGLTITIGAIVTLAVLMITTAKMNWPMSAGQVISGGESTSGRMVISPIIPRPACEKMWQW